MSNVDVLLPSVDLSLNRQLNGIRAISEIIDRDKKKNIIHRRLCPEVLSVFQDYGFLNYLSPLYQFKESDLDSLRGLLIQTARIDPSVAWCLGNFMITNWLLNFFEKRGIDEVLEKGNSLPISGVTAPTGVAKIEQNGYWLQGKWNWASGCEASEWIMLNGKIQGSDSINTVNGKLDMSDDTYCFLIPTKNVDIIDNWNPPGLLATGSKQIVVHRTFVPQERVLNFSELFRNENGSLVKKARNGLISPSNANVFLGLVAIGTAKELLKICQESLSTTFVPYENRSLKDSIIALGEYALASCQISTAEKLAEKICQSISQLSLSEQDWTMQLKAENRLDLAYSISLINRSVDELYQMCGLKSVNPSNRFQKFYFDFQVMKVHPGFNLKVAKEHFGRIMAGLPSQIKS